VIHRMLNFGRLSTSLALFVALFHGGILPTTGWTSEAILIRAKQLYSMHGQPQRNVEVLVRDGRIVGIGDSIRPYGDYQTLEVETLIPGLIDTSSSAGLRGGAAELTREVTPEFETAVTIDWQSRDFREAVAEGTTAVNIMPSTENVFGGFSCLAKTAGADLSLEVDNDRIVQVRSGLAIAMCSDPAGGNLARERPDSIYVRLPTNRMGVVWIIRSRFQQVRDNQLREDQDPKVIEPLRAVLNGQFQVFAVSRTAYDIETWIALADEYKIPPIIFAGHEAYRSADLLGKRKIPVVYTAMTTRDLSGEEGTTLFWNTPGKLAAAEVPVILAGGDLLTQARFAVRFGMDSQSALAAITTRPAALLGAAERLGKIHADFDADMVALDGPPLEFTTNIQWVMVDGKIQASWNGK